MLPEEDLNRFLIVQPDQVYSQQLVTATEDYLTRRLGNEGYNFAKVTGMPEINEENSTVVMKFFIDPGKRTYVRRINFAGNMTTIDDVLRREMRQMESAPPPQQPSNSHGYDWSVWGSSRRQKWKPPKCRAPMI